MPLPAVATGKMSRKLGADTAAGGGDTANGGLVGGLSAEEGVNAHSVITFSQASGAGAFTGVLPDPADPAYSWSVTLVNLGSVALTVYGVRIGPNQGAEYVWVDTAWMPC